MPEGDTIYRTATALRAALLGKATVSFDVPRHVGLLPSAHAVVERVESHGKHLEIGFDDAVVLHTHMRMTGSWHLYRPGEEWRKPKSQARVILVVDGWTAVCFNAPVVELYRAREASRHPGLGSLGPDLCVTGVDIADCVARIDRYCAPSLTVAEVLLDQRVACGVGNVFKSEVLWSCELHPFSPVEALSVDQRFRLLERSAELLQANLEHAGRITVPGVPGGLAVYGRTGKPCPRCGTPVEVRRHGQQARVTYFCAGCQLLLGHDTARSQVAPADADADVTVDLQRQGDGDTGATPADVSLLPGAAGEARRGRDDDGGFGEDRHPAARLWRARAEHAVPPARRHRSLGLASAALPTPDTVRGPGPEARAAVGGALPGRTPAGATPVGRGGLRVVDPLLARRAAGG